VVVDEAPEVVVVTAGADVVVDARDVVVVDGLELLAQAVAVRQTAARATGRIQRVDMTATLVSRAQSGVDAPRGSG